MTTTTTAQLLEENDRLRRRVASRERAAGKRAGGSQPSERIQRELTEALEQQAATSEILRVISSSPTHIQPVLEAVAQSATRPLRRL
jgi:hypothetical protein